MIDFTTLQKLQKNVWDLGKLIVAKGFKKLPKDQKIAKSGHTATYLLTIYVNWIQCSREQCPFRQK